MASFDARDQVTASAYTAHLLRFLKLRAGDFLVLGHRVMLQQRASLCYHSVEHRPSVSSHSMRIQIRNSKGVRQRCAANCAKVQRGTGPNNSAIQRQQRGAQRTTYPRMQRRRLVLRIIGAHCTASADVHITLPAQMCTLHCQRRCAHYTASADVHIALPAQMCT
jgi:hypothetical protein